MSSKIASELASLKKRGPDAFVEQVIGDYTFIFSRLAVISSGGTDGSIEKWHTPDNSGTQPLEKDGWYILCNGEIFNYKLLASECGIPLSEFRCDIDILHYLRRSSGNAASTWYNRLNGDFAVVMYNPEQDHIIVFRDPVGVRPLYMALDETNSPIAFSSLIKPLEGLGFHSNKISRVSEFPPGTIYDNKHASDPFQPQTFMPLEKDVALVCKNIDALKPVSEFTKLCVTECIRQHLYSAVRRRLLHSNVPVAFLCSGGLDSSILLTIGLQIWTTELHQSADTLQVFTIEFKDKHCGASDTFYASLLTKELGVRHTIIQFTEDDIRENLDDIISTIESDDFRSVRAGIPQYFMAKWISENTDYKVIISGEGADELFFGYNYFYLCPSQDDAEHEGRRLLQNIHRYDVLRADRTISNWGLELRVPFLDSDFVKYVYSIPASLRYTGEYIDTGPFSQYASTEKKLLRDSFINHIALKRTRIIDRVKEKFSDGCGLSYIPALIRVMASKYMTEEMVQNTSVHLLEKYESQYVKEIVDKSFKLKIDSNKEFRELPKWVEKKKGKDTHEKIVTHVDFNDHKVECKAVEQHYIPYVDPQCEGTLISDLLSDADTEEPTQTNANIESIETMINELMEKQSYSMLDKTKCSITAKNIYNYLISRFGATPDDHISWNDTLLSNTDSIITLSDLGTAFTNEPQKTKIAYVYYDHMTGETSHYFILFCMNEKIYWFQSAVMEYSMADFILGTSEDTPPSFELPETPTDPVDDMRAYFTAQQALRDWNLRQEIINRINACEMSKAKWITIPDFCNNVIPSLMNLEGSWDVNTDEKCKLYTSLFACAMNSSKVKHEKKIARFRIKIWNSQKEF